MSTHPLTTFIYDTFGQQFGDLLLAGHGAEPGGGRRRLYLTESEAGVKTDWVIKLVARRPPCRDEPLVPAALLKLLLSRPSISPFLEFELSELLAELQWQDELSKRRQVEAAISIYVRLLYDKQVDARVRRPSAATAGGGYYHLLTGYIRGAQPRTGGVLDRTPDGIYFDASFIAGVMQGQVYFAGIDFGPLQTAE